MYEKCVHNLHHDHKWQQENSLGKRVGLYRLQSEVGRGNFSYVKVAIHELTKGNSLLNFKDFIEYIFWCHIHITNTN